MARLRLAVIFGGRACEHDVSVVSALQCMAAVDTAQYELIPVYITREGAWYTGEALRKIEFLRDFDPRAQDVIRVYPDVTSGSGALLAMRQKHLLWGKPQLVVEARIDVALPVLHGMNGEDGAVQGLLELMNVPYTSSGLVGSSVGMDKIAMRELFRGCGFPTLESAWLTRDEWEADADAVIARLEGALPYPMFVKPANLGSSIGIARAEDKAALREGVEIALSYDRRVLVERCVADRKEVNCAALGFGADVQASVCEMPLSWEDFLTFEEKYLGGGKTPVKGSSPTKNATPQKAAGMESLKRRIPAPIGEEMTRRVQQLAVDIFRALDCRGVARIDFMLEGENLFVNEINTIPGSLAFYLWEASGMKYPQLIDRMVELAFRAHAEKNRSVFAFDSNLLRQAALGGKGAKGGKR